MAVYEASSQGQLNGSANYTAYFYIRQNGTNAAGNYTNYAWSLSLLMSGGSAYNNDQDQSYSVTINGSVVRTGTFRLTQADRYNTNRLLASGTTDVAHNADGSRPGFPSSGYIATGHSSVGSGGSGDAWIDADTIAKLPFAPVNLSVRAGSVTTTSFGVDYTRNSYTAIDQDEVQWATDAGFANVVWTDTKAAGFSQPSTAVPPFQLTPGTLHYVRVRSHTSAGWGPYSSAVSQTTLPAVPPGFVVASSPSGSQATLTFSPPGGVTGVTKYVWERRATGTTTPVATGESTVTITTVENLVPGGSYDWRASAWIGTYQSPWTGWTTLVQAKPNVNPGDYFDGSTADVADLDYSWTGTANGSTSIATAKGVAGWSVYFYAGAGVLYRITAGIFSTYAARVQVTADTATWGQLIAGQRHVDPFWTEVTPGATYIGSMYARPSRSQNLAVLIEWLNAAGGSIGTILGAGSVVAGGTWARLVGGGVAPAGAKWAVVSVFDQQGTGWGVWRGGDTLDLDGAMLSLNEQFPYFDGSFLPDGTYVYAWEATAHASQSTRTPLAVAQAGGGTYRGLPTTRDLTDPDCEPVPAPPRPPTVPSDCIEDVGVWRRYLYKIPATLIPDWYDIVPTLEIVSGALPARQVRLRYYENAADLPAEGIDDTTWVSEQIISFMPASTVLTVNGMTQHVWAEVAGGEAINADHLMYGTNGQPATWPVLSCGISYVISMDVPIAEPAGNVDLEAFLTGRV
jgi:hypothetical protein